MDIFTEYMFESLKLADMKGLNKDDYEQIEKDARENKHIKWMDYYIKAFKHPQNVDKARKSSNKFLNFLATQYDIAHPKDFDKKSSKKRNFKK